MLNGRKIIVGVCGGIAAYKSVYLVRLLVKEGAQVQVVMTKTAERFVTPLTFKVLSKNQVFTNLWSNFNTENMVPHVQLSKEADLMIVAPATMNTISKLANGVSDDALTSVYFSCDCPVFVCPSMDLNMWQHPAIKRNLESLKSIGNKILLPETGELASGLKGQGRLLEPEKIVDEVNNFLELDNKLIGKKILITSGPTAEPLDPVRILTNQSTGKTGLALAKAAYQMGAEVTLISGPTQQDLSGLPFEVIKVKTADGMYLETTSRIENYDIGIFAAAVADYSPTEISKEKIKKDDEELVIKFKKTKDILKDVGQKKKAEQLFVGFALETENHIENAKNKLEKKNLDFIVLNNVQGMGSETNAAIILDKHGNRYELEEKLKKDLALDILNVVVDELEKNDK